MSNRATLNELADFIEGLPEAAYDHAVVINDYSDCGTVACALGWAVLQFGDRLGMRRAGACFQVLNDDGRWGLPWSGTNTGLYGCAARAFDITEREAKGIFSDENDNFYSTNYPTRSEVVEQLRLVANNRVLHLG